MSTIEQIQNDINNNGSQPIFRAKQVYERYKQIPITERRKVLRKCCHKLFRKRNNLYPRGKAFQRLQDIEADRYIKRMIKE